MTVTFATIPPAETNARAADRPLLNAKNATAEIVVMPEWGSSEFVSIASNTDLVADGFPTLRAFDGLPGHTTKPTTTATQEFFFKMQLLGAFDIDWFGIFGHNFDDIDEDLTIELVFSDNADYSGTEGVDKHTVSTVNVSAGSAAIKRPIIDLTLQGGALGLRWSSVIYAQLKIMRDSGNFDANVPQIGQLVLGRRRQLTRNPFRPFDPKGLISRTRPFVSDDGSITDFVQAQGLAMLRPRWMPSASDDKFGLDDPDQFLQWFRECAYGTGPFQWIPDPETAPNIAYFMKMQRPALPMPFTEANIRNLSGMVFVEQPPFLDPVLV